MALKRKVKDISTVAEAHRDLYTQKKEGEDWVLTEIEDHDAADKLRSKNTENGAQRLEINKYKQQLSAFEGIDIEVAANALTELTAANSELEVLRSSKGGDSKAIEKAVDAKLKAATTPYEVKLAKLQREKDELTATNTQLQQHRTQRTVDDAVNSAFNLLKVDPSVWQSADPEDPADGHLWARQRFVVGSDGKVVDKVTGLPPKEALEQLRDDGKRPLWFGGSSGTGSSALNGGRDAPTANPWMPGAAWNPDKQSEIQYKDAAKAEAMAAAAGVGVDDAFHPKDGGMKEISRY